MPTYEYECEACAHTFDVLQSMTDPRLRKCPKCGKFKLSRLIGAGSGIVFKGSGFYETDYKRKASLPEGKSASSESSATKVKETEKAGKPKTTPCSGSCACASHG